MQSIINVYVVNIPQSSALQRQRLYAIPGILENDIVLLGCHVIYCQADVVQCGRGRTVNVHRP